MRTYDQTLLFFAQSVYAPCLLMPSRKHIHTCTKLQTCLGVVPMLALNTVSLWFITSTGTCNNHDTASRRQRGILVSKTSVTCKNLYWQWRLSDLFLVTAEDTLAAGDLPPITLCLQPNHIMYYYTTHTHHYITACLDLCAQNKWKW